MLYTKAGRTLLSGFSGISFLNKILALTQRHLNKRSKDNLDEGFIKEDSYLKKFLGRLIVGGGLSILVNTLFKKKLFNVANKKKLKELELLKKALVQTHSDKQKQLWEEISRASSDSNKELDKFINSSLVGEDGKKSPINIKNFIGIIISGKKEGKLNAKSKWIDMKTRQYEDSLDANQSVIYKNIFETQYDIIAKDKLLTSLLSYGVPFLVLSLMSIGTEEKIKEWEKYLK